MAGDNVREIAISGGTISQLDNSQREVPLVIPNIYRPGNGKLEDRIKNGEIIGARRIRGLILEGTRLRSVIAAGTELPFAPSRTPLVFAFNASKAGASELETGESVRVIGTNFVPAARAGEPVTIFFDGEVVGKNVPVRDDGSFSIDIPLTHAPGELVVKVEQRDGQRLTTERATLGIATADRPR